MSSTRVFLSSRFLVLFTLGVTAFTLVGCGMGTNISFPATPETTVSNISLPVIQGSNFGGHAPLVGAHVFVLQPTVSSSGYGQIATSLITGAGSGSFPTATDNTTGSPTNGMKYVTTSLDGQFNISGDYTCTSGLPVYLYASGGNPSAPGNQSSTGSVTITGATGTVDANNKTLITFTTTGSNLIYQGETVTFATFTTGGVYNSFSGTTQTVSPLNLSTTEFSVELGSNIGAIAQQSFTTTVTQASAPSNPAAVNMAVLGICPSVFTITGVPAGSGLTTLSGISSAQLAQLAVGESIDGPGIQNGGTTIASINTASNSVTLASVETGGNGSTSYTYTVTPPFNFGAGSASSINFVYMNEVSTVAAAYGLAGFFSTASNDAVHISIPSGDTLALTGLQNAALTAAQLYDIQGSNVGTNTSGVNCATNPTAVPCDGDAHIARAATTYTAPTGVVPQTLLDTLGNILANCVDSGNTYNAAYATSGTSSTQCTTLFGAALSGGTTGTTPTDTATAAINIAHNPWANVSTLFNSPTGNAPFLPQLGTVPNDFSVGIVYSGTGIASPQGIAADGSGNVWVAEAASPYYMTEFSPSASASGSLLGYNNAAVNGQLPTYVAIDPSGDVWYGSVTGQTVVKLTNTGTLVGSFGGGGFSNPYGIASDGNGDIYVDQTSTPSVGQFQNNGNLLTSGMGGVNTCLGGTWHADHLAIDSKNDTANGGAGYNLWLSSEQGDFVCEINTSTDALIRKVTVNAAQGSASSYSPEVPAVDSTGNVWVPNQQHASISKITQAGVLTNIASALFSGSFGAAIDGAGMLFVANRTGGGITEVNTSTGAVVGAVNLKAGGKFVDALNDAVDLSGNLWVSDYGGNQVVELVGVGAPTYAPLSAAQLNNKLGSKP